jgi:hypothetical protein
MAAFGTYPPLDTPKPVATDVWIVDGPLIRFGPPLLKIPFPTRMTVIRLSCGGLFVHSPTALGPALNTAVLRLGKPRWVVAPSRIHYWWLPAWHAAFPEAEIYAAPRVREQAGAHIDFPCCSLDRAQGYPWDGEIATLPIAGRFLTEVEFFHKPSRTLVLTDLIENFEADKVSRPLRWLMRLAGIVDPYCARTVVRGRWRGQTAPRLPVAVAVASDTHREWVPQKRPTAGRLASSLAADRSLWRRCLKARRF